MRDGEKKQAFANCIYEEAISEKAFENLYVFFSHFKLNPLAPINFSKPPTSLLPHPSFSSHFNPSLRF